jgi:hypothetical protein
MALFGVSALGFVMGSELLIRFHVAPDNSFDAVKRAFHEGDNTAMAFGDSRAASAILDPSGFANFAAAGENLETSLGKLAAAVAKGRLRHALVQLGPQHFSFYRLSLDQAELLEDFLQTEPRTMQMLRPNFRRYLFDYWLAMLRDPGRLFAAPEASSNKPEAVPRLARMTPHAQRRQAMIRSQLHIPVPGFAATADMTRLRETLARVRDAGVSLCLVTFPVSSLYRAAAGNYPIYGEIRAAYAALANDLGVIYVDFWDAFADDNFSNVDHLNGDGARRMSGELRRACKGGAS